jgi:hypothetical protein
MMNLKESFRYQKFLDTLLDNASSSIVDRNHAIKVTKTHLRKLTNPDVENKVEEVDAGEFFANDDVIAFMLFLISEKEKLSCAIGNAKAACGLDIDAATETNKYRQTLHRSVNNMLRNKAINRTERASDYKFNIEGNQTPYQYDVEVVYAEAFDRDKAKSIVRSVITKADEVSRQIDTITINTIVEYEPPYDVNDSFDDAMTAFLAKQ